MHSSRSLTAVDWGLAIQHQDLVISIHSYHPQGERFVADDEKRSLTTIIGQDYSTIDLTAKYALGITGDHYIGGGSTLLLKGSLAGLRALWDRLLY